MLDDEAQQIKDFLVRKLDKMDISTYGLSFSVKTGHMISFTSIVIEKNPSASEKEPISFNILYSKDFNPNSFDYYVFAKNISLETIPLILLELSHKYYDQLTIRSGGSNLLLNEKQEDNSKRYQCSSCLTVYDEKMGDPSAGIPCGFRFQDLSSSYTCPICDSPKSAYRVIFEDHA